MKKIILILLLVFCFVSPVNVKAASASVQDMKINTILDDNGNAHITETWKMSVEEGTEVYKIMENMGNKQIKNLEVRDDRNIEYKNIGNWDVDASMEEKSNKCGLVVDGDHYELCFGISEYGNRTYTFEYDVTHFVEQYNGSQGFNFAFFSDMELDIDNVRITIEYPNYSFDENNSSIYAYGYKGYVVYNSGKVVLGTDESLYYGSNKMQILMNIDDGTFQNLTTTNKTFDEILNEANENSDYDEEYVDDYDNYYYYNDYDDDSEFIVVGLIIGIVVLGGAMIALYSYFTRSTNEYEDGSVYYVPVNNDEYKSIPCRNDLFRFYYFALTAGLINEEDRGGLISAILLKWIRDGKLKMEKRKEKGFFGYKDGFSIDLNNEIEVDNDLERRLLKYFIKAAKSNRILEANEFENWCRKHYDKLENWFKDVEDHVTYDLEEEGLMWSEESSRKVLFFNVSYTINKYSLKYRDELEKVIGFCNYLDKLSLNKNEVNTKILEDYLMYASILNISNDIEKKLGEMYPDFIEESYIDWYYTPFMIRNFTSRGIHAGIEASSSSSSGGSSSFSGGGSGFSGGGGGGVR